jgi:hypothetical protein
LSVPVAGGRSGALSRAALGTGRTGCGGRAFGPSASCHPPHRHLRVFVPWWRPLLIFFSPPPCSLALSRRLAATLRRGGRRGPRR